MRLIAQVERRKVLGPPEHVGRLLAEAEDVDLLAGQLLQAAGEFDDVVVERSAESAVEVTAISRTRLVSRSTA